MEKLMKKLIEKIEGEGVFRSIEIIDGKIVVEFAIPFKKDGDTVVEYNWSWAIAPSDLGKWEEWYRGRLKEEEECFK